MAATFGAGVFGAAFDDARPSSDPPGAPRRSEHRLAGDLLDPLFRNGHALVLSSVLTSLIGVLFWVLAAHRSAPAVLGRNAVALSALTFIGAIAPLNLQSALRRFVQPAGRRARRLVLSVYALSAVVAVSLATAFVLLVPAIAPRMTFLRTDARLSAWFVFASAVWSLMILQDAVLTGLRKTPWVPVENAVFALLKAGLVTPFALTLPGSGIFVSWTVAAVVTIVPTNLYLFLVALPRHARQATGAGGVGRDHLRGFVPFDFLGNLSWLAMAFLLPLLVLAMAGATTSAYFSLAWMIGNLLYLVSLAIGDSLVVELSIDDSRIRERARQVMLHLAKIVIPGAGAVIVGAPWILRWFGSGYSSGAATTLRLLALSAAPFLVVSTAVNIAHARRRTVVVAAVYGALFTIVVPLAFVLLRRQGVVGVAEAVLAGQCTLAAALLIRPRVRLGSPAAPSDEPVVTLASVRTA